MLTSVTNLNMQIPSTGNFTGIQNRDFKILELVENSIYSFLTEDKKLEQPVILSISTKAISKLAFYLSGFSKKPVAIGVAGETASGKSSFVYDLVDSISSVHSLMGMEDSIAKINADNYYHDRSKEVKEAGGISKFTENYDLDVPEAVDIELLKSHIEELVNGNNIYTPKYLMDGSARRYDNHTFCSTKPIILSEGIFNLNKKIYNVFDLCMYVNVSAEAQRERWFRRAEERDFKGEQAERVFENIMNKTKIHIKPTIKYADIIINGEADREDYNKSARKLFDIYMEFARIPV